MKSKDHQHIIDFLVPLALFFAFALSALLVILFATRVYRNTVENSSANYSARTALSYVTEKIHASDVNGAVTLGRFDGYDALLLPSDIQGETYVTAIYFREGCLTELFMKADADALADAGTPVLSLNNFQIQEASTGLFYVVCEDDAGNKESAYISIRSDIPNDIHLP